MASAVVSTNSLDIVQCVPGTSTTSCGNTQSARQSDSSVHSMLNSEARTSSVGTLAASSGNQLSLQYLPIAVSQASPQMSSSETSRILACASTTLCRIFGPMCST